ncbi:MAG: histidine kinase [Alphaproteobacteria bacterium]|nr:histidine kinase [Alphaproteobacteria bacterium]MBV9372076.1 histidine kinase [Alphaproteobacteria bacterium]MBV9902432.1 histidine kinase [Alphaproteobacteria bacterium]
MMRIAIGSGAAVLLVLAMVFFWKSRASADEGLPAAPEAAAVAASISGGGLPGTPAFVPPEASQRSKDERRFARADRNRDGRLVLAELIEPRRKAFAKLDKDGSGQLSFEEWTGRTSARFAEADSDHSGWLNQAEYASTAPKPKPRAARCGCS